jgi:D-aspartate ligase
MQFQEKEFLPVILGADITAYSLARSFHEEYGIKSLVLSMSEGGYIANSDIIENRIFPGLENKDVLVKHLIEVGKEFEGKKKLIVLGCGDWYVRALIESKKELSPYYIIPYIDVDLLNKIVLKDKFYEIFEELGLNYPKTYVYECGKKNDLKFDFDYPVIAKPANSAMYHYAKFDGKKKVFRFNNEEELRDMLAKLEKSSYNYKFLIQDCIPGDDTYMRVLTCYCDQNHKVRFASLGRTLLEDHTPTAIGNPVAIVNEVNPEIVAAATKFLEHIGYTGFANFDIKYDERDGKFKFFEINVRLGRSNFYVTGSGFNTVKWIVDDYIYNKLDDYTVADNINLYTVVPKGVIKKYVPDSDFKSLALKLWSEGKVSEPLFYSADHNLKHNFYARAAYINQFRKFRKYF